MLHDVLYCLSLLELRRRQALPPDALDSFRSRKILMMPPSAAADVASLQAEVLWNPCCATIPCSVIWWMESMNYVYCYYSFYSWQTFTCGGLLPYVPLLCWNVWGLLLCICVYSVLLCVISMGYHFLHSCWKQKKSWVKWGKWRKPSMSPRGERRHFRWSLLKRRCCVYWYIVHSAQSSSNSV